MCGIAGVVSSKALPNAKASLQQSVRTLAHRGPEKEAFWTNKTDTISLGHRRLCIIDLSEAAVQPMQYAERFTIVYNGEIYNYLELKKDLESKGHRFRSQSDTEVILAAYAEWGAEALRQLDGAFAFAIWDEQEQTLFAARDRFGEKPLFFFYGKEKLVFASEIKALWPLGVKKELNESMVYNFLTLGYTSNPTDHTETFYQNVQSLPAAHYFTYSLPKNELQLFPYWQVYIDVDKTISEKEAVEKFSYLFSESIRKRLRSDVAIGTSLSGGLDSSAIVAFCQDETSLHYTHKCFTASFEGFEKDETRFASLVADRFQFHHFTTSITADEVPALMDRVALQQDEPFSSASVLAQYKVFELAKQNGVTVLLDGQGADEILAGYYKYYKWYWQELYRSKQLKKSGELEAAKTLGISENFGWKNKAASLLPEFAAAMLQSRKTKKAFQHPDLDREFAFRNKRNLYYATPTHHHLNGALHFNTFVNGLDELLRLADRNSMAHSVEVRLPFLQHELVEFLFKLPPNFKIHQGWTKWLLRKTVEGKLPKEIVWRKDKIGYEPPQKAWMQNKEVQERIMAAKEGLVREKFLAPVALSKSIVPKSAHEEASYDWRYWSVAHLFNP